MQSKVCRFFLMVLGSRTDSKWSGRRVIIFKPIHRIWTNLSQVTHGFQWSLPNLTSFNIFFLNSNLRKRWFPPQQLPKETMGVSHFFQQQLEHFQKENTSPNSNARIGSENLHIKPGLKPYFLNLLTSTGCWTWKVAKVSSSSLDVDALVIRTNREGKSDEAWNNTTDEYHRFHKAVLVGGTQQKIFGKDVFPWENKRLKTRLRWGICITSCQINWFVIFWTNRGETATFVIRLLSTVVTMIQ